MANNTIMTAKNTFGDALIMDFAPDNTPESCLSNALNATIVTMNGNEYSLQNDMGNGRVETAYLPEGYAPVGTCEFGGIIYIASYNPITNKSQIGCFPSPERNISSEDQGISGVTLQETDFKGTKQENSDIAASNDLTSVSVKKVLIQKDLNPGDKYIVYSGTDLASNGMYLSDYGNTNHEHGKFPKIVKLHIVSIEDSGKITYLDSSVRWYTDSNNNDYYINSGQLDGTSTLKPDIDSYRNVLSSGYSVFQSKVSGKLAILAELESITGFETSYSVYKIGEESGDSTELAANDVKYTSTINYTKYSIYLNFHWNTDNYDINPATVNVVTDEWTNGKYSLWKPTSTGVQLNTLSPDQEMASLFLKDTITQFDISSSATYNDKEIQGYYLTMCQKNSKMKYSDFLENYTFDKFYAKIKVAVNQDTVFNKVTQAFDNNVPIPGSYYIDLDKVVYNNSEAKYYSVDTKGNTLEIDKVELPDIIVNNQFRNTVCKKYADVLIPTSQTLTNEDGTSSTHNLDTSNLVYHYKVRPDMGYGSLGQYECEGYIDFSKINTGDIELTQWRYFIGENIANIQLGLACYEEEGMGIEEVVLEFCDNQGKAAAYHLKDKTSYSGVFSINAALNQYGILTSIDSDGNTIYHAGVADENGEVVSDENGKPVAWTIEETTRYANDAGVLYSNMLYYVRIIVKYSYKDVLGNYNSLDKSKYVTFHRWLWTNTMFNQYYTTLKDFNDQTPELNLDISANYSSSLSSSSVEYETTSTSSDENLSAQVQYLAGQLTPSINVGLQSTYDTFSLYKGDDESNLENIYIDTNIGKKYITSPTNNTYKNVKGTLHEDNTLQPTTQDSYDLNFSQTLLDKLGITSDNINKKELWEDATSYNNQWDISGSYYTGGLFKSFTSGDSLTYYNYNYEEVDDYQTSKYTNTLKEIFNNAPMISVSIVDFSRYKPEYKTQNISTKVIQPLVYTESDLEKFQLSSNSQETSSSGPYGKPAKSPFSINDTSGLEIEHANNHRVMTYKNGNYSYWLNGTNSGTPTYAGKQLLSESVETLMSYNYNILGYTQSWFRGDLKFRNYLLAKNGNNSFSSYVQHYIPYCTKAYSEIDNINGTSTVDSQYIKNQWPDIWVYVMQDKQGNKRPVNLVAYSSANLRHNIVGVLGNLYKVSDEYSSTETTTKQDITYLDSYTSLYTVDMVYKAYIQEETDYNKYLAINSYSYSDYLNVLKKNNKLDSTIVYTNVTFTIGNVLKNIPIQIQVQYKEPDTIIPDLSSMYTLHPADYNGKTADITISGTYNSSTLYIYRNGTLEPWTSYTPSMQVVNYTTSDSHIVLVAYSVDGTETMVSANQVRFENTNSGSQFTYENGDLYLTDGNKCADICRLMVRANDAEDPDQILYFVNPAEILVPWMSIIKQ